MGGHAKGLRRLERPLAIQRWGAERFARQAPNSKPFRWIQAKWIQAKRQHLHDVGVDRF